MPVFGQCFKGRWATVRPRLKFTRRRMNTLWPLCVNIATSSSRLISSPVITSCVWKTRNEWKNNHITLGKIHSLFFHCALFMFILIVCRYMEIVKTRSNLSSYAFNASLQKCIVYFFNASHRNLSLFGNCGRNVCRIMFVHIVVKVFEYFI